MNKLRTKKKIKYNFEEKRFCVLQFDNRKKIPYNLRRLMKRNREHCKKYNINYIFVNDQNDMSPYWKKVDLVKKLLDEDKFDYILWLDSDALINTRYNVFKLILKEIKDKYMLISEDMVPWHAKFNAGVWCVKNSDLSKKMFKEWMSHYKKEKWVKTKEGWKCIKYKCKWSGVNYEQGSFIEYILPKYRKYIQKTSYKKINNVPYNKKTNCINHFAGFHKKTIHNSLK